MTQVRSSRYSAGAGAHRFATDVAFLRGLMVTCVMLVWYLSSGFADADDITVKVIDREGHGVKQVVVMVTPLAGHIPIATQSAVMDQQNLQFVPRVLVVGVGASVNFPNSDSVSHQVYSFSPAKHFQLPLYKGEIHPPVVFDQPGLVVLGCNIHDSMVGYIYVTDAPYFGTTQADGALELRSVPRGDYKVVLWSPFIADPAASLTRTLHVDGVTPAILSMQLRSGLRAQPEPRPARSDWEY